MSGTNSICCLAAVDTEFRLQNVMQGRLGSIRIALIFGPLPDRMPCHDLRRRILMNTSQPRSACRARMAWRAN